MQPFTVYITNCDRDQYTEQQKKKSNKLKRDTETLLAAHNTGALNPKLRNSADPLRSFLQLMYTGMFSRRNHDL